ncbi:EcoRI family type II restriction endonuclease [Helicobacter pylori]|uniref:EcoRI family type II restriction endonuclease n=1 Tax=Helicobacter pylori TaxID=210 RepID=UPI00026ACF53|nr:EcoRI family type II restriction endonuclease [Helicobacter pylori]EJB90935.1 type II site-specific deoxyribonuclease [Helicobacter pylori Hp H-21]MUU33994.1 restriction endonuclease [Helicobacter pylori]MUU36919.1 restriction endonuclease [Helicobacter pylori]MUU75078.1 restriction endonuclease [Helicobacter pylori]WRE95637.1 restriction endonuclease [Helicobacter pylori]
MAKNNQSQRLSKQHKESLGVANIFTDEARLHDMGVSSISKLVMQKLEDEFKSLSFRHRASITKEEINSVLQGLDDELGRTLFIQSSKIKPDGGIIEVKDDDGNWRVILITEAKYQGKDIENIQKGILVGKYSNQDLMQAGNAIERAYKNIAEMANFMLKELHFPYILFLEGSNFLTQTISVKRPDGRVVTLEYNSGVLNRLDKLTATNYGMPINQNLCQNKFVQYRDRIIMLQAISIYTQGDGQKWNLNKMFEIMLEVARTSLKVLGSSLFNQIIGKNNVKKSD